MGTSVGPIGQSGAQARDYDAFAKIDLQDFVQLLVTQLQQQDPMEPMDNSEILGQISQIRQIEADQRLTDTMDSVILGQNIATASGLIDRQVLGLGDDGNPLVGTVSKVSIENGSIKLCVGDSTMDVRNVAQILSPEESAE